MANAITTLRLVLLFGLVGLLYAPPAVQLVNVPLLILIFALDGADGYVARRLREETTFGALYDIAADRVIELVLWIVLSHLGHVPVWAPVIVVTRGVLVDVLRAHAASRGQSPYGMMHTRLGRWLVAGRAMRIVYAVAKAVAFGWIVLIRPLPALWPQVWAAWSDVLTTVTVALVTIAVGLCVARGLPVLWDAAARELRRVGAGRSIAQARRRRAARGCGRGRGAIVAQ